jgi:hypothetical protein
MNGKDQLVKFEHAFRHQRAGTEKVERHGSRVITIGFDFFVQSYQKLASIVYGAYGYGCEATMALVASFRCRLGDSPFDIPQDAYQAEVQRIPNVSPANRKPQTKRNRTWRAAHQKYVHRIRKSDKYAVGAIDIPIATILYIPVLKSPEVAVLGRL